MFSRICFGLAIPLLFGQTAPPVGWRSFTPKDGGFSVVLPVKPKETKQQLMVSGGVADVSLFICEFIREQKEGATDAVTLVVSVSEFPDAAVQGNEDKRLRNAGEGTVAKSKGKLNHERKITLAGHPGRELWIDTKDEGMIHTRLIAIDRRLFQTMAIGPKSAVETKEVNAFLDSLKVKK